MLVACPAPLVALTENLPLCAAVTAGILRTARPSLNEICIPGKAAEERTWPSRNQLTSGSGEPAEEKRTRPETLKHGGLVDEWNRFFSSRIQIGNSTGNNVIMLLLRNPNSINSGYFIS